MDFPVEIGFGNFKVTAHLLFEVLAFIIGYRYYLYLRRGSNDVISETNRIWIIIGAAFGAFFFSRLIGSLESPKEWFAAENLLLYFFASKTIVGGLFGGLLGVELVKILIREKESSGDLFTFPLILALMIGRVGCFTMGVHEDTYGIETILPWGINLGDGIFRHPVSLYEIVFLGMLWRLLRSISVNYIYEKGLIFKLFMIAYVLFRFLLDFIKPGFRFSFGLGSIQITCIIVLIYYWKTIMKLLFKSKQLMGFKLV